MTSKHIRDGLGRHVLFSVALLIATFLVAHTINAYVAYSINISLSSSSTLRPSQEEPVTTQNPQKMAQEILDGHLFLLPPNINMTGASAPAPPPPPPMDVAKKVSLLGTVTGKGGAAMAIVEDLSNKQQRLYRLHETVLTIGSLAAIEKDRVLLQHNDQEEWLDLLIMKGEKGIVPLVTPGSIVAPVAKKEEVPVKRVLDRRYLAEVTADVPRLLGQAQAVPYLTNGKLDGLRLYGVLPTGFFDKIGLQNHDVLQRINGVELGDPAILLALLQQLKNERSIRVDLVRNQQPHTLAYEIR